MKFQSKLSKYLASMRLAFKTKQKSKTSLELSKSEVYLRNLGERPESPISFTSSNSTLVEESIGCPSVVCHGEVLVKYVEPENYSLFTGRETTSPNQTLVGEELVGLHPDYLIRDFIGFIDERAIDFDCYDNIVFEEISDKLFYLYLPPESQDRFPQLLAQVNEHLRKLGDLRRRLNYIRKSLSALEISRGRSNTKLFWNNHISSFEEQRDIKAKDELDHIAEMNVVIDHFFYNSVMVS